MDLATLARWWAEAEEHAVPGRAGKAVLDYVRENQSAGLDELRHLMTDGGLDEGEHLYVLSALVDQGALV